MSSDDPNTKPTLETVLERINSLGHQLHGEIQRLSGEVQQLNGDFQKLNGDFQKLRGEVHQWGGEMQQMQSDISQLREEMDTGFRKIGRKMETLSEAWLEVRGDLRYHDRRIEKLEGEPA